MDLLNHILAPFDYLIEHLFLLGYRLTNNYGLAIILLSLAVSLLLLPIFVLIERSKKRDDAVKRKMKPLLDEIKRCYRGQERYYYIRTVHRQHNYNSFRSLVPILTLLLQIPFFIAAYRFLENYEPLTGQGFLFIDDLSRPDSLLGQVHFLPVFMTLVNLVTAYFYTRYGDKSERRQMVVVAGVFLVLLYNFPSGLVLYWTMNNVFSFFRLFITNPEVFRKMGGESFFRKFSLYRLKPGMVTSPPRVGDILRSYRKQFRSMLPGLKIVFLVILLIFVASQINWGIRYDFSDIALRLITAPFVSLLLTGLAALGYATFLMLRPVTARIPIKPEFHILLLFTAIYFFLAAKYYFTEENDALLVIAVILAISLQVISLVRFARTSEKSRPILYHLTSVFIAVLHILQLVNLFAVISSDGISLHLLHLDISVESAPWMAISGAGILISMLTFPFYLLSGYIKKSPPPELHWLLLSMAVLYICGLLFFWNPMIVYSSYPDNFNFPAINFITHNFHLFIISGGVMLLLYALIPGMYKHLYLKAILASAVIFFLYSSVIPFDVGTLQVYFLSNAENMAREWFFYILEVIFLSAIVFSMIRLLQGRSARLVLTGLILLNLLLVGRSLFLAIDTGAFFSKEIIENENKENDEGSIPFSADGENIIIFVIDGAQGWYMHDLVKEDSSLRETFSGFTYYPNTLAMANYTYASVPSIMCGYDYSIAAMNRDEQKTIIEKVTDATETFYGKIKQDGFDFTSTILRYSRIDENKFDNYIPAWHDSWSKKLGLGKTEEFWYTRLWENALFSSVPLFIKPGIYNDTKWVVRERSNLNQSELNEYNFVRALPLISNTRNKRPNFIYIHSLYTHNPWSMINEQDEFVRDVTPYECQRAFTYTFAEWIDWMKENGVYDNTKIILVSDHGPSWWHYDGEITTTAPIEWTEEEKISLERFLHLNSLLMVKDFNNDFPMREDWRLMNIADVSAIAFDEHDPTKADSVSRTLPTFFTTWHNDLKTRSQYEIKHWFEVTDNVYDLENWEAIGGNEADALESE